MYLDYFNFDREPFHITPDPKFLFLSPSHKEALAAIIYGIENRKGFVCILGEVGLGKTTIVRSYLELADRDEIRPIYVFNSKVTFKELLEVIFQEWGLTPKGGSVHAMLQQLYRELIDEYRTGRNVVLLIDEAQNVPLETLESLRMLSNLETTSRKLIQVVLIGQPELKARLDRPELRQLKQRVVVRTTIFPLTDKESREYIRHRLSHASSRPETVFTSGAVNRIVRYSKGIPRMINIVADNSLIAGYGLQRRPVTKDVVDQVIRDFSGGRRVESFWKPVLAALGLTGALLLPTWQYREALHDKLAALLPETVASMPAHQELPVARGQRLTAGPVDLESSRSRPEARSHAPAHATDRGTSQGQAAGQGGDGQESLRAAPEAASAEKPGPLPEKAQGPDRVGTRELAALEGPGSSAPRAGMPEPPPSARDGAPASPAPGNVSRARRVGTGEALVTAKPGDFLSKLCVEAYGNCTQRELAAILAANPSIVDPDIIGIGQTVIIPPLAETEDRSGVRP